MQAFKPSKSKHIQNKALKAVQEKACKK